MAQQPTSMLGHIYASSKTAIGVVLFNPVSRFIGRTIVEMGERLIPHGASELASAIFTGQAYAPPVLHSPDQGNVHGTGKGQDQTAQVESPRACYELQQN